MQIRCALLYILLLCIGNSCKTGQGLETDVLNRVVLNKSDTIYQFYTFKPTGNKLKVKESAYYYWFRADTILITRNGFDGKLLHGEYKEFYPGKNLKESGQFEYGLKTGGWKSWYSNGELQSVTRWRAGKKEGEFHEFAPNGQKLRSGQYKENKLAGEITNYSADTVIARVCYKEGLPVIQKEKTGITEKKPQKKSSNAAQK